MPPDKNPYSDDEVENKQGIHVDDGKQVLQPVVEEEKKKLVTEEKKEEPKTEQLGQNEERSVKLEQGQQLNNKATPQQQKLDLKPLAPGDILKGKYHTVMTAGGDRFYNTWQSRICYYW